MSLRGIASIGATALALLVVAVLVRSLASRDEPDGVSPPGPELDGGSDAGADGGTDERGADGPDARRAVGADARDAVAVEDDLPRDQPAPPEAIRVRVVDAAGRPAAGVPVLLTARRAADAASEHVLGRVATAGADAEARFPRPTELLERAGAHGASVRLVASCDLPLADGPRVELEPAALGPEPVVLALPPTGSVVAAVRPAEPDAPVRVRLGWRVAGGDAPGWSRAHVAHVDTRAGDARFERVGLGLDLELVAHAVDHATRTATARVTGPRGAGEEVRVELELGPPWPVVTGRALDGAGAPIAGASLRASLRLSTDPEGREHATQSLGRIGTDADGRFRVTIRAPLPPGGSRVLWLERGEGRTAARPSGDDASGSIDLGYALEPPADASWASGASGAFGAAGTDGTEGAAVDVGDVVLALEPVLVGGRVEDPSGRPLADAWIAVRARATPGGPWTVLQPSRRIVDASGRFEVRGRERPVELWVDASRDGLRAARVVGVSAGRDDLVLALGEAGRVEGRVVHDPDIPVDALHVELTGACGPRDKNLAEGMGSFAFGSLAPGEAELHVRTQETDWPVAHVPGLWVRAGETLDDPRLDPIDVRGELVRVALVLAKDDGTPLAREQVRARDAGGRGGYLVTDELGRLVVVAPRGLGTLWLEAPGHRAVETALVEGPTELLLERE